jgi:hypothetical protein
MLVNFQTSGASSTIEDLRLASAILQGAAAAAEAEIAASWARAQDTTPPAAAGAVRRILEACNSLEAALAEGVNV